MNRWCNWAPSAIGQNQVIELVQREDEPVKVLFLLSPQLLLVHQPLKDVAERQPCRSMPPGSDSLAARTGASGTSAGRAPRTGAAPKEVTGHLQVGAQAGVHGAQTVGDVPDGWRCQSCHTQKCSRTKSRTRCRATHHTRRGPTSIVATPSIPARFQGALAGQTGTGQKHVLPVHRRRRWLHAVDAAEPTGPGSPPSRTDRLGHPAPARRPCPATRSSTAQSSCGANSSSDFPRGRHRPPAYFASPAMMVPSAGPGLQTFRCAAPRCPDASG